MKQLSELPQFTPQFLFTDIDDTLTTEGQLKPAAYQALWQLSEQGIQVIPVTGRPAGWCEMIARFWPVAGVVGENGGLYFRYSGRQMRRGFFAGLEEQIENRKKLDRLSEKILRMVPGSAIASDQFCRLLDLAIDFCEDVPALPAGDVAKIVGLFMEAGANAKVSSIHVNGWYGDYDKLTMCRELLLKEFDLKLDQIKEKCTFVGDSPNDEPMFAYFPVSFAVGNVRKFTSQMRSLPAFVADQDGGEGFEEIAKTLLRNSLKGASKS